MIEPTRVFEHTIMLSLQITRYRDHKNPQVIQFFALASRSPGGLLGGQLPEFGLLPAFIGLPRSSRFGQNFLSDMAFLYRLVIPVNINTRDFPHRGCPPTTQSPALTLSFHPKTWLSINSLFDCDLVLYSHLNYRRICALLSPWAQTCDR